MKVKAIDRAPVDWQTLSFENCIVEGGIERKASVPQSNYKTKGRFPVVDQGSALISGYTDDEDLVHKGDLPLILFGDHTRIFKFLDFPFTTGADGTKLFRSNKALVDPRFLYYALLHLDIPSRGYNRHFKYLKEATICAPTQRDEQQVIAAVLSKIQTAVEVQEKIVAKLKELKAATMAKLFREGLCGEILKQTEIGEIPETWEVVRVGDLFRVELGKMLSPKSRRGINSRPYLRNKNVQWGRFDLSEVFEMDFTDYEFERFHLEPRDILICEGGEPGRTAVWEGVIPDCCYQKALHRLRPKDGKRVVPRYYLYWATAAFTIFRSHKPTGTKTTIAHLPKEKLEIMEMALPELSEQTRIVEILDDLDRRLSVAEHQSAALKNVFSSMLHLLMTGQVRIAGNKFTGELVSG